MKIHIVQKGDTLWKIAKKYGVNFEELKKMNSQLSNPDMIMPGMKIKVPTTGGIVKKEAPIAGIKEAKINMGAKKEMPIKEHPFAKEKPVPQPVPEAPVEEPIMEAPVPEAPKVEAKKEEVPKKPFIPKMPKPVVPEIDINNYYLMNMANLSVQQPQMPPTPKPAPAPKPISKAAPESLPKLPPKPKNILHEAKLFESVKGETMDESSMEIPINQGGFKQPMYPFNQNQYPGSPMTAAGYGMPGGYGPQHGVMPHPQVQGAMSSPFPYGGMPGVEGAGYMPQGAPDYDDESSPFMPQMPLMPNTSPMMGQPNQPAAVMGAEDYQDAQLPHMPTMAPSAVAPAMHMPYPCPPYPVQMHPVSPVLPGPGPIPAHGQPFQGYPAMPQVQGVAEDFESPGMYANMPHQMPMAPQQVQGMGMAEDCGCGDSHLMGTYGPGMPMGFDPGAGYGPGMPMGFDPGAGYGAGMPMGFDPGAGYGAGMPMGFDPGAGYGAGMPMGFDPGAGYGPGMPTGFAPTAGYGQGMPYGYAAGAPAGYTMGAPGGFSTGAPTSTPGMGPFSAPPYGQQFAGSPYMSPYGPMGAGYGMLRNGNVSEEYDD